MAAGNHDSTRPVIVKTCARFEPAPPPRAKSAGRTAPVEVTFSKTMSTTTAPPGEDRPGEATDAKVKPQRAPRARPIETESTPSPEEVDVGARSTAPSLALEVRLRALEAHVLGVPSTQLAPPPAVDGPPLAQRVKAVQDRLERVLAESPALKELYDRFDRYAPLLRVGLDDPPADKDKVNNEDTIQSRDLLPQAVQATMVLEAAEDIKAAERGLREINMLNERGVAGAGDLEELVRLKPALKAGQEALAQRQQRLAETRRAVADIVERYHEYTLTVSEMFVQLHEQVTVMEEKVARKERQKQREMKERY